MKQILYDENYCWFCKRRTKLQNPSECLYSGKMTRERRVKIIACNFKFIIQ